MMMMISSPALADHPPISRRSITRPHLISCRRSDATIAFATKNGGGISLPSVFNKRGSCGGKGAIECPGCKDVMDVDSPLTSDVRASSNVAPPNNSVGGPDMSLVNAVVAEVIRAMKGKAPADPNASGSSFINFADGITQTVKYSGSVSITSLTQNILLHDVLYIPKFKNNLLSVSKLLDDDKHLLVFSKWKCWIQDTLIEKAIATGVRDGGLYKLDGVSCLPAHTGVRRIDHLLVVNNVSCIVASM